MRPADLAPHVAFVAQSTFVFEDTVRGNVTLADPARPGAPTTTRSGPRCASRASTTWSARCRAASTRRSASAARTCPAASGSGSPSPARSSGGPRVLVLDDATSAVDPRIEQAILRGLRGAAAPTVLLVAYRMSSVLLADEVVHVEGGRVVDRGTHDELLARDPGYRELATAYEQESARRAAEAADELALDEVVERAQTRTTRMAPASTLGVLATLRRGTQVSPQLLDGS